MTEVKREYVKWFTERSNGHKGSYFIELRCTACGHKDIKIERVF